MQKLKPLLSLSSVLLLASCATPNLAPASPIVSRATEAPDQVAKVCTVLHPVIFSRLHDTVETINQVKQLNAAIVALCPNQ